MIGLQQSIIFLVVFQNLITLGQSQCPTSCLHDGFADTATCSCQCYPAWEGAYCEKAVGNCATGQPSECGSSITSSLCVFDSIKNYCPKLCSSPACTCGYDSCLNNGVFNPSTCSCICPANYYGTVCENYSTCSNILTCQNFGTFNPNTCTCSCVSPNFSGTMCETLTCSLPDPTDCSAESQASCVTSNIVYSRCPRKCGRCIITTTVAPTTIAPTATNGATTTIASTATNGATTTISGTTVTGPTTVVTSCNPLSCQNGFTFNTATCACSCGTGFSGSLCENYNCATSPVPDNAGICPNVPCGDPQINGQCPFKCLCGGTTAAPSG